MCGARNSSVLQLPASRNDQAAVLYTRAATTSLPWFSNLGGLEFDSEAQRARRAGFLPPPELFPPPPVHGPKSFRASLRPCRGSTGRMSAGYPTGSITVDFAMGFLTCVADPIHTPFMQEDVPLCAPASPLGKHAFIHKRHDSAIIGSDYPFGIIPLPLMFHLLLEVHAGWRAWSVCGYPDFFPLPSFQLTTCIPGGNPGHP